MSDLVDPSTGLCLGCEAGSPDSHHLCNLSCACANLCECPNSMRFGIARGEPLPPPDPTPPDEESPEEPT